jgi:hypothetical protein
VRAESFVVSVGPVVSHRLKGSAALAEEQPEKVAPQESLDLLALEMQSQGLPDRTGARAQGSVGVSACAALGVNAPQRMELAKNVPARKAESRAAASRQLNRQRRLFYLCCVRAPVTNHAEYECEHEFDRGLPWP